MEAADRTVPCDHSIRKESCWKAESVIGWSAAQREFGGFGCPNRNPMAKLLFKITQKSYSTGEEGAHRGETLSIALKSDLLTGKRPQKVR